MIKEIAQHIEDKTSFIKGRTLFVGHRTQSAPDQCVVVLESGGGMLYPQLKDRVDKMIQIISRAETYFTARTDSFEIYNVLHGAICHDLPIVDSGKEYTALVIEAVAHPQYIGQDDKRRFEFSTNYIFKIRDKANAY